MRRFAAIFSTFSVGVALALPAGAKVGGVSTTTVEPSAVAVARCPAEMALVGGACVDRWEATLVEARADGTEAPLSPFARPEGRHVRAVSKPGVVPQAYVSMLEARAACNASGKRLCRASEWKAACKGPEKTRYPYGNDRSPGACVDTHRTSPIHTLYGGLRDPSTMNDPRLNQQPRTLEPTGSAAACTNGYGVYDMVGNVHEWVDDGSFRGGYYLDTQQNNEGCDYVTTAHASWYHDYSTGFRCCADPVMAVTGDGEKPDTNDRPEAERIEL